jgi:hypothetical protein
LGQLFEGLAEQLARLEDILNCGYDSMALTKNKKLDEDDTDGDEEEDGGDNDVDDDTAMEKIKNEVLSIGLVRPVKQ